MSNKCPTKVERTEVEHHYNLLGYTDGGRYDDGQHYATARSSPTMADAMLQHMALQRWPTLCCSTWHSNDGQRYAAAHGTPTMANAMLQHMALQRWPTLCCSTWHSNDGQRYAATHGTPTMADIALSLLGRNVTTQAPFSNNNTSSNTNINLCSL